MNTEVKARKKKAVQLSTLLDYQIPRLKLYLVKEEINLKPPFPAIKSAEDAASLLRPLHFASEEHFVSLHLNTKFEVIGLHEVSHGTLSASLVHPREVFNRAIKRSAASLIVVHNHPSGHIDPSREDINITKRLFEAGQLIGIPLIDHIIIGRDKYYSFKEENQL